LSLFSYRKKTMPQKTQWSSLEAAPEQVLRAGRMASLDGIRGIAVLSVIAYHAMEINSEVHGAGYIWRAFINSTWAGVDLFFVLSGFLITGILLDTRDAKGYFRSFYVRRALRIMPLYYGVLIVVLLVIPALIGLSRLPILYERLTSHQLWLWFFVQNYLQARGSHQLPGFGHFWTLAVEEQFYLLWPPIIYFLDRRILLKVLIAVCAVEPAFRFALLHSGFSAWAVRELTYTRFDSLFYGAIAALLFRDRNLLRVLRSYCLILMALASCVLVTIGVRHGFVPYEAPETVIAGYSACGILFAGLVLAGAANYKFIARPLSASFLRWFGRYSFAMYIFHPPLCAAYAAVVAPHLPMGPLWFAAGGFITVLGITSGIAWLSWTILESRCLRLKRYFEPGSSRITITQLIASSATP
jgi:peptidoglycan/LPS O-acetylase OafA/YrhL